MIIAALGSEQIKEEFGSRKFPGHVQLVWHHSIAKLCENKEASAYFDFDFVLDDHRVNALRGLLPRPVFVNSVTETLQEIGADFIRINAWPGFLKRTVIEVSAGKKAQDDAAAIFKNLGWSFQFVPDQPGMISSVIIAQIINEAFYALDDKVSSPKEIDIAMKLGTNYPYGPFEWAELIGLEKVYKLLSRLEKEFPRYRVSGAMKTELNKQSVGADL